MTTANYAYQRKPCLYDQKTTQRKKRSPYPKGTAMVSDNGRDWYPTSKPPQNIMYAKTENGEFYRRRREQDTTLMLTEASRFDAWNPGDHYKEFGEPEEVRTFAIALLNTISERHQK